MVLPFLKKICELRIDQFEIEEADSFWFTNYSIEIEEAEFLGKLLLTVNERQRP